MPVTDGSFDGILTPHQIAQLINLLVDQAPFARSLTRVQTDRRSVAWPTAQPTGWSWLAELAPIPEIGLGDDSYIAVLAKIAGIIKLSNEVIEDSEINVTAAVTTMLKDSLARDLDLGLLEGTGAPEPVGVIPNVPAADGTDLLTSVATAVGDIGDAGGTADSLAISGGLLAKENSKTGANGLFYPAGFAAATGLKPVVVPDIANPLVYDSTRCYLVTNSVDSTVDASADAYFNEDAWALRIKARVAAAIPAPAKTIRKLTVAGAAPAGSAKPATSSRKG
jgi:hypothetical protein